MTFGVGSIQLSFRTIMFTQYIFNPNVNAFQSNCAEGLHFSAFHSVCVSVCVFSLFWHLAQSGVQTAVSGSLGTRKRNRRGMH